MSDRHISWAPETFRAVKAAKESRGVTRPWGQPALRAARIEERELLEIKQKRRERFFWSGVAAVIFLAVAGSIVGLIRTLVGLDKF
ncbi:hypothetical protein MCOR25_003500 [Pyricularia grisea]|nr:hypothetical protein MCOR25_003500 [Pyricularia grisea]